MPKVNEVLRSARISKGITQEQIAKYLGVTKQTVSRMELGEIGVSYQRVIKWANILNVPLDKLAKAQ